MAKGHEGRRARPVVHGRASRPGDRLVLVLGEIGHVVQATGPAQGKATVSIDGKSARTFDQYAPAPGSRSPGPSTGWDAASTRSRFGCSAGVARARPTPRSSWTRSAPAAGSSRTRTCERRGASSGGQASSGSVGSSDLARSSAKVTFRGTGIDWFTYRGPDQGAAGLPRRVARWDGRQLRGVAGVRRGAFVHRSPGRRTHVSDRGPRGRAPRADGALVSIDRFAIVP